MNHPTPETLLESLYSDDASAGLPAGTDRVALDAHVATCPECRQRLEQWRATLVLLDEDPLTLGTAPSSPVAPLVALPAATRRRIEWLPWALTAGIAVTAAFLLGRSAGSGRADFRDELTRIRADLSREIAAELQTSQERDLARLATATVATAAVAQRELAAELAADFQAVRRADRREFVSVLERLDRRRTEEFGWLRAGFQLLADKTGGALEATETRINALAGVLPVDSAGGLK